MVVEVQAFAATQGSQRPSLRDPRAVQQQEEPAEAFNRIPIVSQELDREKAEQPAETETREPPAERVEGLIASATLSVLINEAANRFVYRGLDQVTREIRNQYPSDEELRRLAFLRDFRGRNFDVRL